MNKILSLICFVVFAADLINAATYTFTAEYGAVYKNFVGDGSLPGTLYFHYDSSVTKNNVVRYDHSVTGVGGTKLTIIEFENYTVSKNYKICTSSCEGGPLTRDPEPWWFKSGDTLVSNDKFVADDGVTYCRYTRKFTRQGGISALYLKQGASAVTTPSSIADIAAKVIFNDGREITLKKNTIDTKVSDSYFKMPTNVVCETKACKSYLDIVFVLDESGSIWYKDFATMKTFVRALVGNLTLGIDAAQVGVVMFESSSRIIFNLEYTAVDGKIANIVQRGGGTYQGKGLVNAYTVLTTNNWRAKQYGKPTQFVIALTDGEDFDYTSSYSYSIKTASNKLKDYGVFLIEVGIGISKSTANKLAPYASNLGGMQGYFGVGDFNALMTKLMDLVVPICEASNSSACDPKCHGYCGCSMSCYCPTCTATGTVCESNTCTVTGNTTAGCVRESTQPFQDKCINFKCDSVNGWDTTEKVVCDKNKKTCEDEVCLAATGCQANRPNNTRCKALPNKCHVAKCDPKNAKADATTGCTYTDTCTGESDSRYMGANGKYGCINYVCQDGRCVEQDACPGNATATDCMPMRCNRKTNTCEIAGEDTNTCSEDSDCKEKDKCSTPQCSGGSCVYTPKDSNLPTCDKCHKAQCNAVTEKYELVYSGCGNTDKCMNETCDVNTGKCTYEPKFKYQVCHDVICDKNTGEGRVVPRNCSNPEVEKGSCIRFRCNPNTDACESYQADPNEVCPNDNPLCVIVNCSESGAMCQYFNRTAEGVTNCSLSRCDPATGNLSLYDKCDDGRLCTIDSCDFDGTCAYRPNKCEHMPVANLTSCFFWSCSESRKNGCYRKIFENAYFDECGNCIGPHDDTRNMTDEELTECKKALTWEEKAAVISAGVAGAIVAACVIGAIGVSVGGTLLTRELIKRARAAADSGAVENPMYQDNGREMNNPAFEGEDADS